MDWKPKLQFPNFYPNLTLSPLNLINASIIATAVLFLRSDLVLLTCYCYSSSDP